MNKLLKQFLLLMILLALFSIQAIATNLSIQSTTFGWSDARTSGLELWVFSDQPWTDVDGLQHGAGNYRDRIFTQRVSGLSNNTTTHVLTIPAFSLTPTLNAIRGGSVRLSFWIMQVVGQNVTPIKAVPGSEDGFQLPATITSISACSPASTCATWADLAVYNSPSPPLPREGYYTRSDTDRLLASVASGGVTSLNAITGAVTIAAGSSGTDFAVSPSGSTITLNLPDASATARGVLSTGTQTIAGLKTFTSNFTAPVWDKGGRIRYAKAYGALCDNATDDTAAIQAAITASDAAGDTVELPPGTCIATTITIADKMLRFIGAGDSRTTLKAKAGTTGRLLYYNNSVTLGGLEIGDMALDLSAAPTIVGLEMNKIDTGYFHNLRVNSGSYGIKLSNAGSSVFRDLIIRSQTTAGVSVNGDNSAELKWDNVEINLGSGVGFEILRTTATDIGGHWLTKVKVVGGYTTGIKLSSSIANAAFFTFLDHCTADLISAGNAVLLTNAQRVRSTGGHFYSSHATALGVKIDGGGKIEFVNNYAGSTGGGFDFANAPAIVGFDDNIIEGAYAFKMPGSSPPTDFNLGKNHTSGATALTNDYDKLAVAQTLSFVGGMQVLTSSNGGANSSLSIRNSPGGQVFYVRGGSAGGVEFINNAFSASVAQITDAGIYSGSGFQVSGVALAASHLSNGVSGTGAVALVGSPVFTSNTGIGRTPQYRLDINSGAAVSQVHLTASDADSGGYLLSTGSENLFFGSSAFNGANWVAKGATSSFFGANGANFEVYVNSGLTPGNTFTPTKVFGLDLSVTANDTRLLLWDVTAGSLVRVSRYNVDSCGAGFRCLRIPN